MIATKPKRKRKPRWLSDPTDIPAGSVQSAAGEFRWFFEQAKFHRRRTMRAFAEQEIILPNGPFEGGRYRCRYQPYVEHWFDAIDSGNWNRFAAVGPVQSGKTLSCYVIPALYHLFEIGETVVVGLPSMDIAEDKWREDFFPVLECTRYRDLMPTSGAGSRNGNVKAIKFRNGATLRFMSGGGKDKKRSAFTARVVLITEVDGLDESSEASRESDKVSQIEARSKAFGRRKRVYLECTTSIETGRIWQEYINGTQSQILCPCVHCGEWVLPEREHFIGAKEAKSAPEAVRDAAFHCPECAEPFTERDRMKMVPLGKLVHEGQAVEVVDGGEEIVGEPVVSNTLGFRWSAWHNLFLETADIANDEFTSARDPDEDNADRRMLQQVWAKPYVPPIWDDVPITVERVMRKSVEIPRGICPPGTETLSLGIDVGKYRFHWSAIAWGSFGGHVVDYGQELIASDELGTEAAILAALRDFRDDVVSHGWSSPDGPMVPGMAGVDSSWATDTVYTFCNESPRFVPIKGWGSTSRESKHYPRPKKQSKAFILIGNGYHVARIKSPRRVDLLHIDSDIWKSRLHEMAALESKIDGSLTLFDDQGDRRQHFQFAKHLTSEKRVEEFEPGRGTVVRWVALRRANHWFDTAYIATMLGGLLSARKARPPRRKKEPAAVEDQEGYGFSGDRKTLYGWDDQE